MLGPFSKRGGWFRGNCHTHTTLSDGTATAERIADAYRAAGYDFIVLTDHNACREDMAGLSRPDFLVINGIEMDTPATARRRSRRHHIVGIGIRATPPVGLLRKGSARAVIGWMKRQGGIPIYGHPYWSGHDTEHIMEGRGAFGVEVFNTTTEMVKGLGDASVHLDQALSRGLRWAVFAVDDTHRPERDAFGGWIMVRAPRLTERDILDAISRRRFYATCGPEIRSIRRRGSTIVLTCKPVREIVWHCAGSYGTRVAADGDGLVTRAEFDLKTVAGRSLYVRAELIDAEGRKAWTNPLWYRRSTRTWTA